MTKGKKKEENGVEGTLVKCIESSQRDKSGIIALAYKNVSLAKIFVGPVEQAVLTRR